MKKENKGFTLAEMLIVVAIIGILVAILVPTFTKNLEKAKEAADAANIRSAISEVSANFLLGAADDDNVWKKSVELTQTDPTKWVTFEDTSTPSIGGVTLSGFETTSHKYAIVKIDSTGTITVTGATAAESGNK